jgi:hypothetical protein
VPTKRRRLAPSRINAPVPAWAQRLLAGERPALDSEDEHAFFGWLYMGDQVPGLPDPMSKEGCRLWQQKGAS